MHRGEALQHAELGRQHRVVAADPAQVVAQEIDDHHVLGPVLGAGQQLRAQPRILLGRAPARPRALDRPRLDLPPPQLQEPLRRRRRDRHLAEVEDRPRTAPGCAAAAAGTAPTRPARPAARPGTAARRWPGRCRRPGCSRPPAAPPPRRPPGRSSTAPRPRPSTSGTAPGSPARPTSPASWSARALRRCMLAAGVASGQPLDRIHARRSTPGRTPAPRRRSRPPGPAAPDRPAPDAAAAPDGARGRSPDSPRPRSGTAPARRRSCASR